MLITLPTGGSSNGLSLAKAQVKCGRAAWLNAQHRIENDGNGGASGEGASIGTCFHALQEKYANGELLTVAQLDDLQWGPEKHPCLKDPNWADEAVRLMRWWLGKYRPHHFGRVIGAEMPLPPENDDAKRRLSDEFSGLERTARIDKLVYMDSETSERLNNEFGIDSQPGTVILDWKVVSRRGFEGYVNDLQSLYYQQAFQACYPDQSLAGMLFVFVVRNKAPVVEAIFVHPPNRTEKRVVMDFLRYEYKHRLALGNYANASACYEYGKPCWWLQSGKCDRSNGRQPGE